ncbi:hypothetical protein [Chitinophaga sp. XS-30]|uniref:hypothetical protein n=1 Tax=Chitinophaga sp. XS-30 TaxID=2604421 RepID=UPI0011DCB11B|nr:hypothetical protein [Chitinophaga sp. XS-30]QEH43317.1 hypothetical protein FW415_21620 [Chitinophaga sp. XS-30]
MLSFRAGAQVSMTALVPPAGVIQKAQLWNILLVSAGDGPVKVRVALRLMDAKTNEPILTGITRVILLQKGAKQLQADDVMPVQYEYLSPAVDRSVNGLLFAGNYLACYTVVIDDDKTGAGQREDCIPFTIEPVSPPLLNQPAQGSVLESRLPQFTWLPPAPLNLFNDLNYELTVTEVRKNQSPEEAVQQNIPVFRATRLKEMFINYPSSAVALDTGKLYAWSVSARNGSLFAAQTEVWTFRVQSPSKLVKPQGSAYVQLRKELDGTVIHGHRLQLGYTNETGDSSVRYEVVALEEQNRVVQDGVLHLKRGSNLLDVALERKKGLSAGKSYLFRLKNSRLEYWQIKFIYTRED